jgi:tetratricopeptide (TPR) repeat protein
VKTPFLTTTGPPSGHPRCSPEPCETTILRLQRIAGQNPGDWRLQYQIGICHSGQCQIHSLVCPDRAVDHLRCAYNALHAPEEPLTRAVILGLLGVMYTRSSPPTPTALQLRALECHHQAAAIYFELGAFAEWARMQHNLGNTWCELPHQEFPGQWDNAIAHYELALRFRTQQADPDSFAATLENLGTAYRQRATGDKAANVGRAIHCYRRALRVWKAAAVPDRWAALHNNLGNACLSLPFVDVSTDRSRARHAILHFDLALRVRTPERNLFDYAVTKLNRGQACLQLGVSGSQHWLAEALGCLRDAHAAFLRVGGAREARQAESSIEIANRALNQAGSLPLAGPPSPQP